MSFAACLAKLKAEGAIDPERARRFQREYDRLAGEHGKVMGEAAAADAASRDAIDALKFDAIQQRRQKMLQVRTQQGLLDELIRHAKKGGKAQNFAVAVMEHHEAVPGMPGVANEAAAVRALAWSKVNGFLERFSHNLLGEVRNKADMADLVRERFGEKTGNANAAELSEGIGEMFETLRQMFNAAGGQIGKLERFGLPQYHDAIQIAKAGLEPWKAKIKPRLDLSRMRDNTTGQAFTERGLDDALNAVYDNIVSEGLDKVAPGQPAGLGKMANRRADHRFLHFKSADDWMAYQNEFGVGDPMNAITGLVGSMAQDIAAMRLLGPNPAATIRWMDGLLRQASLPTRAGTKAVKLDKGAAKGAAELDRMWRMYSGELTQVAPENRGTARFFSGIRNWNVASSLGSAFVSAVATDPFFASMTAKFNDLPIAGLMANYVKAFNPADPSARAAARDAGLVWNELTVRTERLWREGSNVPLNAHEMTRRLADGVLRATFLSPHTVAMKDAVALSFMQDWAQIAGKNFADLPEGKRLSLERYGISADDWSAIRTTPLRDQEGSKMLRPGDVASREDLEPKQAERLALKMFAMIDSEMRFAVPGELLRAQTAVATLGGSIELKRGTFGGELLHSASQFKSYGVIALMTHWSRMVHGHGAINRATYALSLPFMLTIGGMIALQLKAIAGGKDPGPMDAGEEGRKNWARAVAQGGGFGIAGDFIQAGVTGQSRTGGTILGFVSGPTISKLLDPAVNLTLGNAGELADGSKTNIGRESFKMLKNNIPGSSAWYARLAFNRLALDQLESMIDPNYRANVRRLERASRDQGQGYYWAPGEEAPDRAPDFSNAFGQDDAASEDWGAFQ